MINLLLSGALHFLAADVSLRQYCQYVPFNNYLHDMKCD